MVAELAAVVITVIITKVVVVEAVVDIKAREEEVVAAVAVNKVVNFVKDDNNRMIYIAMIPHPVDQLPPHFFTLSQMNNLSK